jgi:predicted negative regulator of RcsB-dependent stress response
MHNYNKNRDYKIKSKGLPDIRKEIGNAIYYAKKHQYEKEDIILTELERYYPNEPHVKFERAKYYQGINRLDLAESILKKLSDSNEENKYAAMYELAKIYSKTKRLDDSLARCNTLLVAKYRPEHVYIILGDIAYDQGNVDQARYYYQQASKDCDLGLTRLADLAIGNGRISRAVAMQEDINTDNITLGMNYYRNEIRIAMALSHYSDTTVPLRKMEECLNSHFNVPGLYFVVKTHVQLGHGEYAHELFDKYSSRLPDNEYKELALANLAYYDGKDKEELEHLFKVIQYNDHYISKAYDTIGQVFKRNKKYDEAQKYFIKALEVEKYRNDGSALELAYYYMHKGNMDEVEKYVNMALQSPNRKVSQRAQQFSILLAKRSGQKIDIDKVYGYLNKQIVSYDKEYALEHIKEHTWNSEADKEKTKFRSNIDIRELYDSVLKEINDDNIIDFDICDSHLIKKEHIGFVNDKEVDYMLVNTITGTKDIITMFPVASANYNMKKVFDDDEEEEKEDTVVKKEEPKKLSMIDKFNKRYGFK